MHFIRMHCSFPFDSLFLSLSLLKYSNLVVFSIIIIIWVYYVKNRPFKRCCRWFSRSVESEMKTVIKMKWKTNVNYIAPFPVWRWKTIAVKISAFMHGSMVHGPLCCASERDAMICIQHQNEFEALSRAQRKPEKWWNHKFLYWYSVFDGIRAQFESVHTG